MEVGRLIEVLLYIYIYIINIALFIYLFIYYCLCLKDLVLDDMVNKNHLEQDIRLKVRDALLKKKRHQGVKTSKKKSSGPMSSFGSFAKKASSAGLSEMLKRSDSSHKTTAPKTLEVVTEDKTDGEFPHLPSAVDLVGKERESGENGDIKRRDSDQGLEAVTQATVLSFTKLFKRLVTDFGMWFSQTQNA